MLSFLYCFRKMRLLNRIDKRFCSTKMTRKPNIVPPLKKAVIVSSSSDIYTNLALENWFFKNEDFTDKQLLMLWVNDPCVVIGRHQNPWVETSIANLNATGIKLARRNSGGGTVYHDSGNLNMTFFSSNQHYNRYNNLELITNTIFKKFKLKVDISKKEDLLLRNYKISGTASKLARTAAYHHCTLLVKADTKNLRKSLQPIEWEIKTNATKSIKSKIINLSEENPEITIGELLKAIGLQYLLHNNKNITENNAELYGKVKDENKEFAQVIEDTHKVDYSSLRLQLVTPKEEHFPGINKMFEEFRDWKWIYGRTPKFTASKAFKYTSPASSGTIPKIIYTQSRSYIFVLNLVVENGVIVDITFSAPQSCNNLHNKLNLTIEKFKNEIFTANSLNYIEESFTECNLIKNKVYNFD